MIISTDAWVDSAGFQRPDELLDAKQGDIVKLGNRRYQVTKKTTTAMSIVPYRWYHSAADWIIAKVSKV